MDLVNDTITNGTTNTTEDPEEAEFYEKYLEQQAQQNMIFKTFLELFTVLSLVCIAINLILCYVIIKYRRLRRDKSNVILMHWTILNTLFMIFSPTSIRISMEYNWIYFDGYEVFCAFEQLEMTLLLGNLLLIVLLLISWYLKLYHKNISLKFERNLVFFIASVYVLCVFCIGLHVHSCFNTFFRLSEIFLGLTYLVFIVFMIVMNLVHLVKRRKLVDSSNVKNTPLILANTFFLSVCPLLLAILLQFVVDIPMLVDSVIVLTSLMLAVLNSIYFFGILYRFDKDYNTFLSHVFSCKCKEYSEDELVEEPVIYNRNVQNVQM